MMTGLTTIQHVPLFYAAQMKLGDSDPERVLHFSPDGKLFQDLRGEDCATKLASYEDTVPLLKFLNKFVTRIPGERDIGDFFKNNPGKNLLDYLTPSDVAYTFLVLENGKDVWDEAKMMKEMTASDRKEYTPSAKPRYHTEKGTRLKLYRDGWTKPGKVYYLGIEAWYRGLMKEGSATRQQLMEHWEAFAEDNSKYKSRGKKPVGLGSADGDDESDEEGCIGISLPTDIVNASGDGA